ncbi:MAG: methyltransferase domain-containing protein [Atribacterota bacterium]|jgi:23S rRNA (guanine745-N1)-methyltransferase|nr:methyltransferase domain-containing protein [Atribacterota bacterium]MDD4895705.1 methyltransferase domain-containing protein [Atribacterota bacterium]MDD5636504.1 methyltransferase domain-containing protein [Atribacterota bacterium]
MPEHIKKIELAKRFIAENIKIFRCPVCSEQMLLKGNSLLCLNKHCFDLSRKGYLNLLMHSISSKYDRQMLNSRKIITRQGFFQALIERIGDIIIREIKEKKTETIVRILDAGCGEGTNLVSLLSYLSSKSNLKFIGIGLDISREGIHIASVSYPGNIWLVADLANCPLNDQQFDIIINILSPANYAEFKRILKDSELFIKVLPGSSYLQEIRKIFYTKKEKREYSNEEVIALLGKNFNIISQEQLVYKWKLRRDDFIPIIEMTPLSWSINKEDIKQKRHLEMKQITVDLTIVAAKKQIKKTIMGTKKKR